MNNLNSTKEKILISKTFKTEDLLLSKIHLSKNWNLPKYRSKRKSKSADKSFKVGKIDTKNDKSTKLVEKSDPKLISILNDTSGSNIADCNKHSESAVEIDEIDKKRLQNRLAQRSYRFRTENKINNLENMVESLQSTLLDKNKKIADLESNFSVLQNSYNKLLEKFIFLQNDQFVYNSMDKITVNDISNTDTTITTTTATILTTQNDNSEDITTSRASDDKSNCQTTVTLCNKCDDIEMSCINSSNSKILGNNVNATKSNNNNNDDSNKKNKNDENDNEIDFTNF